MEGEDRISELPQHVLQNHILSFLPQKKAVRTCILSKSWRHLGPTRPKIEFHESDFRRRGSEEKFLPVVENTLQRYDDQKLSVQEFVLSSISYPGSSNNSNSLLNKWIVKLHMLKRLSLHFVCVEQQTFENIMSSCPWIEHLVLDSCQGLSCVKVNRARNLKHLNCRHIDSIEINDDAPSLETIHISDCEFHLHNNNNNCISPLLKSLYLWDVHLPAELLNNLSSNNWPCLEELQLRRCSGFTEFKLSSRSIKRLVINLPPYPLTKVAIDAANILYFEFSSGLIPSNYVSFTTTWRKWKSRIEVRRSYSDADDVSSSSTWYPKLHEFLRAISQSQISLDIPYHPELTTNQDSAYEDGGISEPPVAVEHLCLRGFFPFSALLKLLNCLFPICRPRYINLPMDTQLMGYVWKTLVSKGETTTKCHFWQQDLEETSIQVLDENRKEWHDVQVCEFPNDEEIRLRLKWRDFN